MADQPALLTRFSELKLVRTMDAGGVPNNNSARGNIASNDGTRADGSSFTNRQPWKNGRIRPDRGVPPDDREERLAPCFLGTRVQVVSKSSVRSDTNVVLECDPVPELDAALDRDAVADSDLVFNETMRADVAVASDNGTGQHYNVLPDTCSLANLLGLYVRIRMNEHGL